MLELSSQKSYQSFVAFLKKLGKFNRIQDDKSLLVFPF